MFSLDLSKNNRTFQNSLKTKNLHSVENEGF